MAGAGLAEGEGRRVALVIGNTNYEHASILDNAVNDAETMAAVLGRLGFDVVTGTDLDLHAVGDVQAAFEAKLRSKPEPDVALLFYAGHGLQVKGRNYLVPVGAQIEVQAHLSSRTILFNDILEPMVEEASASLIFLDACRDNPFTRNLARTIGEKARSAGIRGGLARIEKVAGTFIAYATAPDKVAYDGKGDNSPFTAALLKHIETPGLSIGDMMIDVRNDVLVETQNRQEPWDQSSLRSRFYFVPKIEAPTPAPMMSAAADEWAAISNTTSLAVLALFKERYPKPPWSEYADIRANELRLADRTRQETAKAEADRAEAAKDQLAEASVIAEASQVTSEPIAPAPAPKPTPAWALISALGGVAVIVIGLVAWQSWLRPTMVEHAAEIAIGMSSSGMSSSGMSSSGVSSSGVRLARARGLWRLVPQVGHAGWVLSVAFSPDGTRIVSGGWDKTLRLWDAATGRLIRTMKGHEGDVNSVAFSPDGTRIVSGGYDNTVRLWDAATGRLLRTMKGHEGSVISVAFSPDGTRIVSGSWDKTLRLWDAATGRLIRTMKGHAGWVLSVAFSPDGTRIVSGGDDNTVRLWDAATGRLIRTMKGHAGGVISVAFSPDGTRIVSGSSDKTLRLWDAATGRLLRTMKGHAGSVLSVAFSPDGTRIVSGSDDKTLRLWDAATGRLIRTMKGHASSVRSVAFSPDGTRIVSGSSNKTVRLWDAATGRLIRTMKGHAGWVRSVAFSPDGTRIVSGSYDKTVRLWDAATGRLIRTMKGHGSSVRSVAFSPDGTRIVSGSSDKTVRLWDAATGRLLRTMKGHPGWVNSVAFSPDGTRIVSKDLWGIIITWDGRTGRKIRDGGALPDTRREVSSDGHLRLRASGNFIDIIDQESGQVVRSFTTLPEDNWVAYTPWGPYTASAGAHKYLTLAAARGYESTPVTEAWRAAFFRPHGLTPADLTPPAAPTARK